MNGRDDDYEYDPQGEYEEWQAAQDDDGDTRTDLDCPFCRGMVEYDGAALYCDECEVVWHNVQEWAADRTALALFEEQMCRES